MIFFQVGLFWGQGDKGYTRLQVLQILNHNLNLHIKMIFQVGLFG